MTLKVSRSAESARGSVAFTWASTSTNLDAVKAATGRQGRPHPRPARSKSRIGIMSPFAADAGRAANYDHVTDLANGRVPVGGCRSHLSQYARSRRFSSASSTIGTSMRPKSRWQVLLAGCCRRANAPIVAIPVFFRPRGWRGIPRSMSRRDGPVNESSRPISRASASAFRNGRQTAAVYSRGLIAHQFRRRSSRRSTGSRPASISRAAWRKVKLNSAEGPSATRRAAGQEPQRPCSSRARIDVALSAHAPALFSSRGHPNVVRFVSGLSRRRDEIRQGHRPSIRSCTRSRSSVRLSSAVLGVAANLFSRPFR